MDMLQTLVLYLHSWTRWLVLLVAVIAIVIFALTWLRREASSDFDRRLMGMYTGLFDLQTLLGVIILVWGLLGGVGLPRYRLEHAVTMVIALVVVHLAMRWRNAPAARRARNNLIAVVVSLALVLAGISALPVPWRFAGL